MSMKFPALIPVLCALSLTACFCQPLVAAEPSDALKALRILNVGEMDWDDSWAGLNGTSQGKLLYSAGGSLMLLVSFNPGWDAINKSRHYHNFHEWGYVLEGDFLIYDFVSPEQTMGTKYTMRSGTWMSRPAFSIHGNRPDAMVRQKVTPPSVQLVFSEGGKNYSLDPNNKWYSESWRDVTQWTHPLYQNSALPEIMEWEPAGDLSGAQMKLLSNDIAGGFRARILYVPPGWSHTDGANKSYFVRAHRFIYMLAGDLSLGQASAAGGVTLGTDFFVDQKPGSVWHWAEGENSSAGAMWLEVTYAKSTRFGHGPIETPTLLPSDG